MRARVGIKGLTKGPRLGLQIDNTIQEEDKTRTGWRLTKDGIHPFLKLPHSECHATPAGSEVSLEV
jgi:hypothetical protein